MTAKIDRHQYQHSDAYLATVTFIDSHDLEVGGAWSRRSHSNNTWKPKTAIFLPQGGTSERRTICREERVCHAICLPLGLSAKRSLVPFLNGLPETGLLKAPSELRPCPAKTAGNRPLPFASQNRAS